MHGYGYGFKLGLHGEVTHVCSRCLTYGGGVTWCEGLRQYGITPKDELKWRLPCGSPSKTVRIKKWSREKKYFSVTPVGYIGYVS